MKKGIQKNGKKKIRKGIILFVFILVLLGVSNNKVGDAIGRELEKLTPFGPDSIKSRDGLYNTLHELALYDSDIQPWETKVRDYDIDKRRIPSELSVLQFYLNNIRRMYYSNQKMDPMTLAGYQAAKAQVLLDFDENFNRARYKVPDWTWWYLIGVLMLLGIMLVLFMSLGSVVLISYLAALLLLRIFKPLEQKYPGMRAYHQNKVVLALSFFFSIAIYVSPGLSNVREGLKNIAHSISELLQALIWIRLS